MVGLFQPLWTNPIVRGLVLFSIFRAVYGVGILVFTYLIATSENTPWWSSLVFLACSMVFSRWLFRRIKARWPGLFSPNGNKEANTSSLQTTP